MVCHGIHIWLKRRQVFYLWLQKCVAVYLGRSTTSARHGGALESTLFNHFNVMPQLNILSLALTHVFQCINHSSSAGFHDLNQTIISKNYVNEFSVLPWLFWWFDETGVLPLKKYVFCEWWRCSQGLLAGDNRQLFWYPASPWVRRKIGRKPSAQQFLGRWKLFASLS